MNQPLGVGVLRKTFSVTALGLVMAFSVVLGAIFPVPPAILLSRRRRTDRMELVLPGAAAGGLGPDMKVPATLLRPQA